MVCAEGLHVLGEAQTCSGGPTSAFTFCPPVLAAEGRQGRFTVLLVSATHQLLARAMHLALLPTVRLLLEKKQF